MQTLRYVASCLAVFSLAVAPLASAKDHKKGDKAKVVKECTDKGGTWDKKKKKCTPAAAAKADAPKESIPEESAPAPDETAPSNPE